VLEEGGLALDDRPAALGGRSVADALLEPTVIYVRAVLDLLRSDVPVHGLAHITGGGLRNLLRLGADRLGFAIEDPLPVPAICTLVAELGDIGPAEMWDVFNMGCGFVALVPEDRADDAVAVLAPHHEGTARIGAVTGDAGRLSAPGL
jgi:phosphoribosylformylglycinamidine cyclo-ligase